MVALFHYLLVFHLYLLLSVGHAGYSGNLGEIYPKGDLYGEYGAYQEYEIASHKQLR
jgi:hypothetical protein